MYDNITESLDRQLGGYAAMARQRAAAPTLQEDSSSPGWARFAAATGATLASVTAADAAITHVVPPAPIRVEIPFDAYSEIKMVDLNNDFVNDIQLGAIVSAPVTYYGYRYFGSAAGLNGLQMLPDTGSFASNIRRFAANDVIPAVAPGGAANIVRVSATSFSDLMTTRGNWQPEDLGFAGFVFGAAGSKRAGWIQIRTRDLTNGRLGSVELVQWAYESVPGTSIKVGQTASALPGDYNGNGSVGPEDYTVWKNTFNNNVAAGTGADGNANGKVDAADYTFWRDRTTSAGSGALAAAVPEPATVSLGVLALGAAGVAALRRRAAQ